MKSAYCMPIIKFCCKCKLEFVPTTIVLKIGTGGLSPGTLEQKETFDTRFEVLLSCVAIGCYFNK